MMDVFECVELIAVQLRTNLLDSTKILNSDNAVSSKTEPAVLSVSINGDRTVQ